MGVATPRASSSVDLTSSEHIHNPLRLHTQIV
jgi:hypothetical protein